MDLRLRSQPWQHVKRCDSRARELADRHYSRQTPGARDFMPPGRTFVLYREGGVWGVVEHLDPRGHGRPEIHVLRAPEPSSKSWRDAA